MQLLIRVLLVVAGLTPSLLLAQNRPQPADSAFTEPDQELDSFYGQYEGIHYLSATLRGVRAANQTVYWVSADNRHLAAYQVGKRLWITDVGAPFTAEIPTARISSLTLSTELIFVSLGKRGLTEVDRKTGRVTSKYFDRNPNHLLAD